MVRIESSKLAEFISVVSQKARIKSLVLKFKSDGLYVDSKDENDTTFNFGMLEKSSFDKYNLNDNQIGIKSSNMLISILKSFSGPVNIDLDKNLLTIYNDNKNVSLVTADITYLNEYNLEKAPEKLLGMFDSGCVVKSSFLANIVKNATLVKSEEVNLVVKDGRLNITTGDEGFDKITESENVSYRNVESSIHIDNFKSVIGSLDSVKENVKLSFSENNEPIQLFINNENYKVRMILAPMDSSSSSSNIEEPTPTNVTIDELVDEGDDLL